MYICIHTVFFKPWKAHWKFQNIYIFFFCRHTSPSHAAADKHSGSVALLTWCYPSRWCEKASPVLPRSACRQRRRPGTHPETASRHLQADTEANKRSKMWTFFQEYNKKTLKHRHLSSATTWTWLKNPILHQGRLAHMTSLLRSIIEPCCTLAYFNTLFNNRILLNHFSKMFVSLRLLVQSYKDNFIKKQ